MRVRPRIVPSHQCQTRPRATVVIDFGRVHSIFCDSCRIEGGCIWLACAQLGLLLGLR